MKKCELKLTRVERAWKRSDELQFAADELYRLWGAMTRRADAAFERAEDLEKSQGKIISFVEGGWKFRKKKQVPEDKRCVKLTKKQKEKFKFNKG